MGKEKKCMDPVQWDNISFDVLFFAVHLPVT
jgi:hypothetical protein